MTILLIIFLNPNLDNLSVEFDNRTACIDAKRELISDRINARVYCFPKHIEGLGNVIWIK